MEGYNEYARCPKCGGSYIGTRHVTYFGREALERDCGKCGYHWKERPLDADKRVGASPPGRDG